MNPKVQGILTAVGSLVLMIVATILVGVLMATNSSDGWAAIGAVFMMFFLTGIILIVELIAGLVIYSKKKSEFALGLLYGIVGIFGFGIFGSIVMGALNLFG